MNQLAIRLEEQIISMFPDKETQVCYGWILKKMENSLLVYPLYPKFAQENISDNIQKCEEISHQSKIDCVFRIVEHTNYYLRSILTDNGYGLKNYGIIGEWNLTEHTGNFCFRRKARSSLNLKRGEGRDNAEYMMTDANTMIGIKWQEFLFLPDKNLSGTRIEDLLWFSMENGITRVVADIQGEEELPPTYDQAGFHRAYLYCCYQKEDIESGCTK